MNRSERRRRKAKIRKQQNRLRREMMDRLKAERASGATITFPVEFEDMRTAFMSGDPVAARAAPRPGRPRR